MPELDAHDKAALAEMKAVKAEKTADVAVAPAVVAVQKTETRQDFAFAGVAGGRFAIYGKGFGAGGTVKINSLQAVTTEWGDGLIVGHVPAGIKTGTVTVEVGIDDKTSQRGTFQI